MSKQFTIIGLLVLSLVSGCNQMGANQTAEAEYLAVRDRFLAEERYAFWGVTKMLSGNSASGSAVTFSGHVQGDDVFLNVRLPTGQNRVNTLSLLNRGQQLYAKLGDDGIWRTAASGDVSLEQEMNNWNPIASFQQMEEMRTRVLPLQDLNRQDNVKAVRVLLDSDKLKQSLARQLKQQLGQRSDAVHKPSVKVAMNLADAPLWRADRGVRVRAAEAQREIDNLIDNMELEAEYTLYYDAISYLPTRMLMKIRAEYDRDGQRVQEYTQVDTQVRNYGQRYQLPRPNGGAQTPERSETLAPPAENSHTLINQPNP